MADQDLLPQNIGGGAPFVTSIFDFSDEALQGIRNYLEINPPALPLANVLGYSSFVNNAISTAALLNKGATLPASPTSGDIFFLTTGTTVMLPFQYDGTNWFSSAVSVPVFAGASNPVTNTSVAEQGSGTLIHPLVYAADAVAAGCSVQARVDVEIGCDSNAETFAELGAYVSTPGSGITWIAGTLLSTVAFFPQFLSSPWVDAGVSGDAVGLTLGCYTDSGGGSGIVESATAQVRFKK